MCYFMQLYRIMFRKSMGNDMQLLRMYLYSIEKDYCCIRKMFIEFIRYVCQLCDENYS